MSLSHKAYRFDWRTFESDSIYQTLIEGLRTGEPTAVARYVATHRLELTDPYEGEPLPTDWEALLENRDVHEYADFALTRFYDAADDRGLAEAWQEISALLAEADRVALLGTPIGDAGRIFDPGRQGSYFQTPAQAAASLRCLEVAERHVSALGTFVELLREAVGAGHGVYVTF